MLQKKIQNTAVLPEEAQHVHHGAGIQPVLVKALATAVIPETMSFFTPRVFIDFLAEFFNAHIFQAKSLPEVFHASNLQC